MTHDQISTLNHASQLAGFVREGRLTAIELNDKLAEIEAVLKFDTDPAYRRLLKLEFIALTDPLP